jgi:hypothetical protein
MYAQAKTAQAQAGARFEAEWKERQQKEAAVGVQELRRIEGQIESCQSQAKLRAWRKLADSIPKRSLDEALTQWVNGLWRRITDRLYERERARELERMASRRVSGS